MNTQMKMRHKNNKLSTGILYLVIIGIIITAAAGFSGCLLRNNNPPANVEVGVTSVSSSGEQYTISNYVYASFGDATIHNLSIIYLNEDEGVMARQKIGTISGSRTHRKIPVNVSLKSKPEWIVLQPGLLENPHNREFSFGGLRLVNSGEWEGRYNSMTSIEISRGDIDCEFEIACARLRT